MEELLRQIGVDENTIKANTLFMSHAWQQAEDIITKQRRFVHYTRADTALKILRTSKVWARKANCMNDFSELEHGFDCLNNALTKHKEQFTKIFDGLFPGFREPLIDKFNSWLPHFRNETYIVSLSEHLPQEDDLGRLSMWRAYGGSAGVAMVIKPWPLIKPTDALGAYASPVAYLSVDEFETQFLRFLDRARNATEFLQTLGAEECHNYMFTAFRFAMLCTKHPGFHEEREWRIVHGRTFDRTDRIEIDVETVGNIPQKVCKIPLKDYPDEGLTGIEIPNLLDRLIVGPSDYPFEIQGALIDVLESLGVPDAQQKVIVSDMPLRT